MGITKKQNRAELCFMMWELVSEIHTKKTKEKAAYFYQSGYKALPAFKRILGLVH